MNIKRTINNYKLKYIKCVSSKCTVLKLTNIIFIWLIILKGKEKDILPESIFVKVIGNIVFFKTL